MCACHFGARISPFCDSTPALPFPSYRRLKKKKRRKVEQEKNEAAGTGDGRQSEPMEETRERRPTEEEVERDSKRSRPGGPEAGQASGSTYERRDISMEVDGLDGGEIEEDELHIASLEADADGRLRQWGRP